MFSTQFKIKLRHSLPLVQLRKWLNSYKTNDDFSNDDQFLSQLFILNFGFQKYFPIAKALFPMWLSEVLLKYS